jgi:hypothetical protein
MASWISVYCTASLDAVTAKKLAAGIRGKDDDAPAGVDYLTLAEQYGVDDTAVKAALGSLSITKWSGGFALAYGAKLPVRIHRWTDRARVADELAELPRKLAGVVEVVGIELAASQLRDFGVVVAYEVARYLAQKANGVTRDLGGVFGVVRRGAFVDL